MYPWQNRLIAKDDWLTALTLKLKDNSCPNLSKRYHWALGVHYVHHSLTKLSTLPVIHTHCNCNKHWILQILDCSNNPTTARVKNQSKCWYTSQGLYPVHLKVKRCQTLRVVSTFTGQNESTVFDWLKALSVYCSGWSTWPVKKCPRVHIWVDSQNGQLTGFDLDSNFQLKWLNSREGSAPSTVVTTSNGNTSASRWAADVCHARTNVPYVHNTCLRLSSTRYSHFNMLDFWRRNRGCDWPIHNRRRA